MTHRIPFFARGLNLALFGAVLGPRDRSGRPPCRRPEKLRYQPRRHRRLSDEPGC